jgi:transposase-like protein
VVQVRYSGAVARRICERIARGASWLSLSAKPDMPDESTLSKWRRRHPVFAEALAQAREVGREARAGRPVAAWPAIFEQLEAMEMDDEPRARGKRAPQRRKERDEAGRMICPRYGAKTAQAICERLAEGVTWESLAGRPGMPARRTLYKWMAAHPGFAAQVAEAKRIGAEARFDEALEVARATTRETVVADKLRVDVLMRQAAMMDPARFGKGGPNGGEPRSGVRQITVRRFERGLRADGTEYVRAIDTVQDVEDRR